MQRNKDKISKKMHNYEDRKREDREKELEGGQDELV